jgi:hypothetical protein
MKQVGRPIKDSLYFDSVEKMTKVFIGINDRLKDINENTTYSVEKIIPVCVNF